MKHATAPATLSHVLPGNASMRGELWGRAFTWQDGWRLGFVVLVYYVFARLGLTLQFAETQASPVWPPSGLALAVLMVWGYRLSYGVFVGALLANTVDFYLKNSLGDASVAGLFTFVGQEPKYAAVAIWIALGNTAEAVLGLYCIDRVTASRNPYLLMRHVAWFFFIALLVCVVGASNGVASLVLSGVLPSALFSTVWFTWWLGDAVGMFVLTPFFVLAYHSVVKPDGKLTITPALIVALLVLCVFSVFSFTSFFFVPFFSNQAYLLLPVLVVITLVAGSFYSSGAVLLVSIFAIWGTISGSGPFILPAQNDSLLLLQGFIAVIAFTVLLLDSLMCERKTALEALRDINVTLERRVEHRTSDLSNANKELARSNQELDDFCHIASHDLKEPLRGIRNQVAFLLEDFGADLPAAARERIDKIPPIIDHLNTLVSSLLHYSRVGRMDFRSEASDLHAVVSGVLASLENYIIESGVDVRQPQSLPSVKCDGLKVGEVFRNLITNAIKYNDKENKWLEIGAIDTLDKGMVFYVRDNGIGIHERHHTRIFTIFKRLHATEAFGGGAGVGMTIVKKIVERHGGEIWVESELGVGTAFYFTLGGTVND